MRVEGPSGQRHPNRGPTSGDARNGELTSSPLGSGPGNGEPQTVATAGLLTLALCRLPPATDASRFLTVFKYSDLPGTPANRRHRAVITG